MAHSAGGSPSGIVPSILKRAFVDTRSTIGPGVTAVTSTPGNRVDSTGLSHSGVSSSASVSGIVTPLLSMVLRCGAAHDAGAAAVVVVAADALLVGSQGLGRADELLR